MADGLDKWAEEIRFRIGDSLVWKHEGGGDSVLQVTKDAYLTCNTSKPIAEYSDGNSTINLTRSGSYYFISRAPGQCEKGQKLTVIVLSILSTCILLLHLHQPVACRLTFTDGDTGNFGWIGISHDVNTFEIVQNVIE